MYFQVKLREATVVYQGLLKVFTIIVRYSYRNAIFSGEDTDALIDAHLMLKLCGLLVKTVLYNLGQHLLVQLARQRIDTLM